MQPNGMDALDRCLTDIRAGRKTLAECLAENTADQELQALLPIALAIDAVSLQPDPVRKLAARHEFVEALYRETTQRRRWTSLLPGIGLAASPLRVALASVLVSALLLLGAGGAASVAAQTAQPGDPLYGLKTAIEQAQVAAATSPEARAQVRLEIAGKRLSEVEKALETGRVDAAHVAAVGYAGTMSEATRDIDSAQANPGRHAILLSELQDYLQRERAVSEKAREKGADSAQAALEQGADAAVTVVERSGKRDTPTPSRGNGSSAVPAVAAAATTQAALPTSRSDRQGPPSDEDFEGLDRPAAAHTVSPPTLIERPAAPTRDASSGQIAAPTATYTPEPRVVELVPPPDDGGRNAEPGENGRRGPETTAQERRALEPPDDNGGARREATPEETQRNRPTSVPPSRAAVEPIPEEGRPAPEATAESSGREREVAPGQRRGQSDEPGRTELRPAASTPGQPLRLPTASPTATATAEPRSRGPDPPGRRQQRGGNSGENEGQGRTGQPTDTPAAPTRTGRGGPNSGE